MEDKAQIKQRYIQKFSSINPTMVEAESLQFYLGRYVDGKLLIKKSNLKPAFQAFKIRLLEQEPNSKTFFKVDEWHSLNDALKADTMSFIFDQDGNVIDVDQGGDLWATWVLKYIPEFIEAGSYFLIVDDEEHFWKVTFENNHIKYWRQG